jgi:uncharacterized protein (UPF0332 family)
MMEEKINQAKMMEEKINQEAESNFDSYLRGGLIKKERNEAAFNTYIKNSDLSLKLAEKLVNDELKPYLWVVVCSYYSMFYIANAVLLRLGYKISYRIVHKVTSDTLIVLVMNKLKKELLEEYEKIMDDALEIASAKAEDIIENYNFEMSKRSKFQYEMSEEVKEQKARIFLSRAKEFVFEMNKLLTNLK